MSIADILVGGMDGPLTPEQHRQLQFVRGSVRGLTEMVGHVQARPRRLSRSRGETNNKKSNCAHRMVHVGDLALRRTLVCLGTRRYVKQLHSLRNVCTATRFNKCLNL